MVDRNLRESGLALILITLGKNLPNATKQRVRELSMKLENACFDQATAARSGKRDIYIKSFGGLCRAFPQKFGEFLESTLAESVASDRVTLEDSVKPETYQAYLSVSSRQTGRALFFRVLLKDSRFDKNRADFARRIERGCYNMAITRCEDSEDSYRRQWDSRMFISVYSARCGVVAQNLDPKGSVAATCRKLGSQNKNIWALDHLADGSWKPENLGAMTATELCPLAGKEERTKVSRRLEQKVDKKTSSLFACPRCHARNCTYRQVQIGAADEIGTFMCECQECNENYEGYA